ncbi:MAG TPA: MFS transporter, partial [Tetragenococcus sp.]|nr:MFS transporter [Tetragenococcus sp.]
MNKWMKFILLYVGATLIGMSQLKIAPVINPLADYLGVSLTQMSWLTSIFTISGIFIAIPGGALVTKIGAKKLLILITALLAVGNFLGTLSSSYYLLLFSRVVEGISFATIVMTGVVLISYWFKDSKYSATATGIFTTFPASASLLSMNLFLPLSQKFGPYASWYLIGSIALVMCLLYLLFLDAPDEKEEQEKIDNPFAVAAKNGKIWLLGIMQGCMAFVLYAYIALYPVLFSDYYGLSQTTSNFYSSLFGLFGIPFGVLAGYLIDKTKRPGWIIFSSFAIMSVSCLAAPFLAGNTIAILLQVFFLSVAASLASSSITIMVPENVTNKKLIGYSMSIVNLFYYSCIV